MVSEATAIPTEPQQLLITNTSYPYYNTLYCCLFLLYLIAPFPTSFSFRYFHLFKVFSKQLTESIYKICPRLDWNRGPMVSEATAIPTEPQQLLITLHSLVYQSFYLCFRLFNTHASIFQITKRFNL